MDGVSKQLKQAMSEIDEIIKQYPDIGSWGGKFVVLIPEIEVI